MSGCTGQSKLIDKTLPAGTPARVELEQTPFFPQRDYECGPAALATVLTASGVAVTDENLRDRVYLPGRKGSLQVELVAATRGYDRLAYRISPRLEAVVTEVAGGRPVLVLQNLGLKVTPVWHYAVVIGFDAGSQRVILRSGTTQRLQMSTRRFMRSWSMADSWALVMLKPGEMPVDAQAQRYVEAVSGLEAVRRYQAAMESYRAADARWPGNPAILLGMGNIHYAQRELSAAADSYRSVLAVDSGHAVARNNLAQVLLEQGDVREALAQIEQARASLTDPRFAPLLTETENEIRRALGQ